MNHYYFVIARALHIIAVVIWIGGVAFVTTVLIPAIRRTQTPENRLKLFEILEGKFSFQAKFTTLFTGASGLYLLYVLDAWEKYTDFTFWWLHLMTFVWVIFSLVLFVLEPLFLHKWFHKQAKLNSEKSFMFLQNMHIVLLAISLLAIFGAVVGAHGLVF